MKYLIMIFLLPVLGMASHSLDIGTFYANHSEKGYKYTLGGLSLSYEIGNSKGLKARGKFLTSTNSDLLFIQANHEVFWHIPIKEFHVFPLLGVHTTRHEVFKKDMQTGVLHRTYLPVGAGFYHKLEDFEYNIKIGHLQPIHCYYICDECEDVFYGTRFRLHQSYMISSQIIYNTYDKLKIGVSGEWKANYRQNLQTWNLETFVRWSF